MTGGYIKIISDFKDDHHELVIRNTGQLNGSSENEGFGISSTRNRLHLIFGEAATFEIRDTDKNEVEAKVTMPVRI